MTQDELGALLNVLLEAERAGAKLLAAWLDELSPSSALYARLREVQRDEAHNCAVLIHHLLEAGTAPSAKTGEFCAKGLAIREWRERLEFLNRGQAWVARRLSAALPRIQAPAAKKALEEMRDSHLANIGRCEALIA